MAALSYDVTKRLIHLALNRSMDSARSDITRQLENIKSNAGQFYDGIIKHGPGMKLSTDQWFDLLSKFPNRILRHGLDLESLLSEEQLRLLPPSTG
jgi:hypothetical protein